MMALNGKWFHILKIQLLYKISCCLKTFQYVLLSGFVMFFILAIMKTPWDSFEVPTAPRWTTWTKATENMHVTFMALILEHFLILLVFCFPYLFTAFTLTPASKELNPIESSNSPPKHSELFEVKIEVENSPPKYTKFFKPTYYGTM